MTHSRVVEPSGKQTNQCHVAGFRPSCGSQNDVAGTRQRRCSKLSRQKPLDSALSSRTLVTRRGAFPCCGSTKPQLSCTNSRSPSAARRTTGARWPGKIESSGSNVAVRLCDTRNSRATASRAFVIEYADWRPVVKTDNRPAAERANDLANLRIDTFGGHTLHAFAAASGTFDALAWGTVQTGRWGALPHRAYAFDVEAGFQPTGFPKLAFAKWKPWLRAGVSAGSGDANPDDNRHGTFFQLLLTPRPYARFPFFNMMNTQDRFGSLLLRPHARLTLSSEFHALRLSNRNDLWYLGGGAFQPWTFGFQGRSGGGARSFANLYDTQADIRVSRAVSLTGYFAYAQGLAVTRAIYPRDKDARFGFLELTYRF